MAATTLAQFVAALRAVEVPGVRRQYSAPPASITTADMPALWLRSAVMRVEPSGRGSMTWPTLTAELWLAVGPISQGRVDSHLDAALAFVDVLVGAIGAADLAAGRPTMAAQVAILTLNEKSYWGVTLTVEARG